MSDRPGESLHRRPLRRAGLIQDITPQDAGWEHVGFQLHRLSKGQGATGAIPEGREGLLVMVEGRIELTAGGRDWGEVGARDSCFEFTPPHAVYLPSGADWAGVATSACEIALCTAPSDGRAKPARVGPEGIETVDRGRGTNLRHINPIAMEERDVADRLLVTEVLTPPGHWSSYPPHRHDEDDFPRMTLLEETYYHRLDPSRGYAHQRVFTEEGDLDETMSVSDRDLVLVPRGHHPCAAPHGYRLYYLNVMAGPMRRWRFQNHPDHDWIARRDA